MPMPPVYVVVRRLTEVEALRWRLLLAEQGKIDADIRATGMELGAALGDVIAPHEDGHAILRRVVPPTAPEGTAAPG